MTGGVTLSARTRARVAGPSEWAAGREGARVAGRARLGCGSGHGWLHVTGPRVAGPSRRRRRSQPDLRFCFSFSKI
jgi:hypothetical protein